MIIKLKGILHPELIGLGLKPGRVIKYATADKTGKTGAVYFTVRHPVVDQECVVWPENYDVIKSDKPIQFQFTIT
jgi:hypothetical protein